MCALASRAASPGIGIAKSSSSVKSVTACIPFAACSLRRALCIRAFGGTDPSAAMQLSRFAMQKKPSNANQHFSKRAFTPRTCSRPVAVRWSSECSANLKAIECTFTPRRLRCPSCVAMRVDLQCSLRSLDASGGRPAVPVTGRCVQRWVPRTGGRAPRLRAAQRENLRFVTLDGRFLVKNGIADCEPLGRFCTNFCKSRASTIGSSAPACDHR